MDSDPCVSCIIPTYNRAELLPRALDSVIEQTYENLEIIVVDDGSTDGTRDILNDYADRDDRIRIERSDRASREEDRDNEEMLSGGYRARNRGIEAATGEYIAFLDDDDEWLPEKIEKQLPLSAEYSMVSCLPYIIDPQGKHVQSTSFDGEIKEYSLDDIFQSMRHFYPSGVMLRAEYAREVGGFDESSQTWEFFLKLVHRFGSAAVLNQPLVNFDNAHDFERVSEGDTSIRRAFDVYHEYKHLVSPKARRRRLGNLYLARYGKEANIGPRVYCLVQSVRYNKRNVFRIAERFGVRLLPNSVRSYVDRVLR